MKKTTPRLQKLEHLLIDVDMRPTVPAYFRAVGFNVVCADQTKVDIHSDRALVAFARHYHRILVCHDRHRKPSAHKLQVCIEIYKNGGQVIQVAGEPKQEVLTSLGKILANRYKWSEFFKENDGIVTVYDNQEMKVIKRGDLLIQIEKTRKQKPFQLEVVPTVNPKALRIRRKHKPKPTPTEQLFLEQSSQITT